jgi:membrane-associated protein
VDLLRLAIDFILHVDQHLLDLFNQYGLWIFGILFLIIFCETGLVVTPFLPGDSLLFATGAMLASTQLNIHAMALSTISAAILGNVATPIQESSAATISCVPRSSLPTTAPARSS